MFDSPIPESCQFFEFRGDNITGLGTGQSTVRALSIPNGASMFMAVLIGPGGAGGNGFTGAAGTARGGGGGGASGSITRIILPAKVLPPVVYVAPGRGGIPGTNGNASVISIYAAVGNPTNINDLIAIASAGGNGGNGTGAAAGAAGSAGAAMAGNSMIFGNFGVWQSLAGQNGAAGGAQTGAVGGSVTWGSAGNPTSGGAGGGGVGTANTDQAGGAVNGNITATNFGSMPTTVGGVAAAGAGKGGFQVLYGRSLPRAGGGSGGGTAGAAGTGGVGGPGGFGSGGGGGGGGVTGGAGGNGGPGWIGIWIW